MVWLWFMVALEMPGTAHDYIFSPHTYCVQRLPVKLLTLIIQVTKFVLSDIGHVQTVVKQNK